VTAAVCLALPGQIVAVHDRGGVPMAEVDFRGARQEVCLEYVPEAVPGDWVLAHLGVALQRLDEEAALADLALLAEAGLLPDETGAATG
jgi:hydrogenase expression/formation protein HypC